MAGKYSAARGGVLLRLVVQPPHQRAALFRRHLPQPLRGFRLFGDGLNRLA
jgi:hypothetical protein